MFVHDNTKAPATRLGKNMLERVFLLSYLEFILNLIRREALCPYQVLVKLF
jgi:hypothetical protein